MVIIDIEIKPILVHSIVHLFHSRYHSWTELAGGEMCLSNQNHGGDRQVSTTGQFK